LSRLIARIKDLTSARIIGRPGLPRISHVPKNPKLLRCQPITVAGFMMVALSCQSSQTADNHPPQKSISGGQLSAESPTVAENRIDDGRPESQAEAPYEGEQGNRRKNGTPQFVSNFEICENHNRDKQRFLYGTTHV